MRERTTERTHKAQENHTNIVTVKGFIPATEPPDPRRSSEGFLKGSLKGFPRVFEGVSRRILQNPFKRPSRTLLKPFKKVSKSMMR